MILIIIHMCMSFMRDNLKEWTEDMFGEDLKQEEGVKL